MGRYVIRRLLLLIPVLFFISIITFSLAHAVPGGPFDREKALPPEVKANLEKYYGLDQPVWKQYVDYVTDVIFRFDFGPSYRSRGRGVNDIFKDHLPVSAQLGLAAMAIALAIGLPLGILAALKQNTIWDYLGMGLAIFGVSVPAIVLGPMLILIFALSLHLLPVAGWGTPAKMIMPALALGLRESAIIARLTRASMLQVIREDYIRTARAKGLTERVVMVRHALKNAFIPVATILGPMFAALVTGTFIVEQIFAIPGMGKYFITSITNRDYPVVMGTILLYAVFLVLANLAVDLTYAFLDPRIRYT
ncbi:MAG: Dipeptide transport system permease protein DppB [Chloroflexi bacterium ADurb.Bin180]|nr:MAG: Dipeptide transport system permease protein DppB [Chloroflexi bacterium ADurb.Bin180]